MGIVEKQSPSSPPDEAQVIVAVDSIPRDATDEEVENLPHLVDKLPPAAWAAALIGASERFSYYCFVSIWRECFFVLFIISSVVPTAGGLPPQTRLTD